ncbi:uncharacterized protein B0H64DRAFT_301272, partial [Chaetomium fimeti]
PEATSKKSKKLSRDAAQSQTRLYYHSLLAYHQPYLTDKAETMLGITIAPLDLLSDHVSDSGPRFIGPASTDKMKKFVEDNGTWDKPILLPIREDDEEHPNNLEGKLGTESIKYYKGFHMLNALEVFARTPYIEQDSHNFDWFNPDWKSAIVGWSKIQDTDSKDMDPWSLQRIFESTVPDRPHTHAFVNHVIQLENDKLTTGEMAAATGIISSQRCFRGFNHHRYIPATIFSASFRDFRIVQVWHDRESPNALHVRRSPILDFMQGKEAKRDDWVTLLCWFMGEQLETTMPSQVS